MGLIGSLAQGHFSRVDVLPFMVAVLQQDSLADGVATNLQTTTQLTKPKVQDKIQNYNNSLALNNNNNHNKQ